MKNLFYILGLLLLCACGVNPGGVPTLAVTETPASIITGVVHDPSDEPPLVTDDKGMLVQRPLVGVTYETQNPVELTFGGTSNF